MTKAIETRYKGYRFRSRLEARWAVFFDALRIEWMYELEGFDLGDDGWYLPDFWLPGWGCHVEIKPDIPDENEMGKFFALVNAKHRDEVVHGGDPQTYNEHYMICGSPGVPKIKFAPDEGQLMTVADGYVCLACSGMMADGLPDFAVSCFAMVNGGKELDIWPLYITEQVLYFPCEVTATNIRGMNRELWSLYLFGGGIPRMYVGDGIYYDSMPLRTAYTAARSARFEYGAT